jgi:hypothetical protein
MIGRIIVGAHWLDAWLQVHLGRPYRVVLAVGLVVGISASIHDLSRSVSSSTNILKIVGMVLFQLALLINQLAQFHEHRQRRRARKHAKAQD